MSSIRKWGRLEIPLRLFYIPAEQERHHISPSQESPLGNLNLNLYPV